MNLRQLHYFVEVSDLQSVTLAAARLRIAQPALTRHMRALQRDLGVELFSRTGRGIVLTNAGMVFRDRVTSILRELDRARVEVQALSRTPGGRIDIGMPASISQALTRAIIEQIGRQLPKTSVRVIDGWTGFIVEWLLLGRLELGVVYDHTLRSNLLQIEPLALERHFLVSRTGEAPVRRGGRISLAALCKLPLALPSREHGLRVAIEERMRAAGLTPRIELEVESTIAIKQFVQVGGIHSILPLGDVGDDVAADRLVLTETEPAIERMLSLAWARERKIDARLAAVIGIMRRETQRLIETGTWGTSFLGPRSEAF